MSGGPWRYDPARHRFERDHASGLVLGADCYDPESLERFYQAAIGDTPGVWIEPLGDEPSTWHVVVDTTRAPEGFRAIAPREATAS